MSTDTFQSAEDQITAVANGDATIVDLVRELLDRAAALDENIRAWSYLDPDTALQHAAMLDRTGNNRARGLIFAVKDNFDTHDMPTAYGSPVHSGHTPARDASPVATLRLGGGLLLGKTVSTEFAHVHPGPTMNPWNTLNTPGGSSSGSAAAVASGMVPVALGSQTTGSVIRPAAYCGVVGFKPSYGDINTSGMLANAPSFDTVGIMSRTVRDANLVHCLLTDNAPGQFKAIAPGQIRVGFCPTPFWDKASEETKQRITNAVDVLAKAGFIIREFDDRGAFDDLEELNLRVSGFEFARTMAHEHLYEFDNLSQALREGRLASGLKTSYESYVDAKVRLRNSREILDSTFADIDVVIAPSAPDAAPAGLKSTGSAIFNMPWTSLHTPAVTLPVFRSDSGLPIGLQVIARRNADKLLLQCAESIYQELT